MRPHPTLYRTLAFTRYCFTSKLYCGSPSSIHHPCIAPLYLQSLLYCNHIARPLRNIRSPTDPSLYAVHHTIVVMAISCKGQIPPPSGVLTFSVYAAQVESAAISATVSVPPPVFRAILVCLFSLTARVFALRSSDIYFFFMLRRWKVRRGLAPRPRCPPNIFQAFQSVLFCLSLLACSPSSLLRSDICVCVFFFLFFLHIIQLTPQNGRKNRTGAKGASAWPEDQKRHRFFFLHAAQVESAERTCTTASVSTQHIPSMSECPFLFLTLLACSPPSFRRYGILFFVNPSYHTTHFFYAAQVESAARTCATVSVPPPGILIISECHFRSLLACSPSSLRRSDICVCVFIFIFFPFISYNSHHKS